MKLLVLLFLLLISSCAPLPDRTSNPDIPVTSPPQDNIPTSEPYINPFSPKPGDENLSRGNVFIAEASLVIRESYPLQISLSLSGDLSTPCHELRAEIAPPDIQNKIMIDVYSVFDPNSVCVEVIKPFQENIDLGTFPGGQYSVWVNGELAGEFDT